MHKSEKIMADYRAAFNAVYGRPVQIDYYRGWYSVFAGSIQVKYRERDIVELTNSLRSRIA